MEKCRPNKDWCNRENFESPLIHIYIVIYQEKCDLNMRNPSTLPLVFVKTRLTSTQPVINYNAFMQYTLTCTCCNFNDTSHCYTRHESLCLPSTSLKWRFTLYVCFFVGDKLTNCFSGEVKLPLMTEESGRW